MHRWLAVSATAGLLLAVALLMIGSAVACSGSSGSQPKQTATGRPLPTRNAYEATLVAKDTQDAQTAAARLDVTPFCAVDLPESWRAALAQGKISLPDTDYFDAKAVAADASQVFGALYSDAWSGVVAVDRQGSITRIRAFANPNEDQISAAFDGRWLVWQESHSITNWSDWDIRASDSRSGEVFDIATAARMNGAPVSGPFVIPLVSQGKAGWLQANEAGALEVHLYDLAGRQDRVVSVGQALLPVVFWGSKLLWGEHFEEAGADAGHLVMADAATGEPSPVPEPLASIRQLASLGASKDVIAWTEDHHAVTVWRVGEPKAQQIFAAGPNDIGVDWIAFAGDYVMWERHGPTFADLRSGSIAPLTGGYTDAWTNGNQLLVVKPLGPLVKNGDEHHLSRNHFEYDVVDVTKLPPLPRCPS